MNAEVKVFSDLEAWKAGHGLVLDVYRLSREFPKEEGYGMTSQLRRAASSITANIAEGFGRYHFKDKIRFYYQARGSAAEVQNFLILAKDLGYLSEENCSMLTERTDDVLKLINGLIRSIENQNK